MNADYDRKKKIKRILEIERLRSTPELQEEWRQLHAEVWGGDAEGRDRDLGEELP